MLPELLGKWYTKQPVMPSLMDYTGTTENLTLTAASDDFTLTAALLLVTTSTL